jgi:hypothetical protein
VSIAAAEAGGGLTAAQRAAMRARADQISTVVPARGRAQQRPPARTLPAPAPRPSRPATPRAGTGRPPRQQRSFYAQARRAAPTTRIHRTNYQPVILAEFVAAVLLVALSPVASKKNPGGVSPYDGQDMIKVGAVTGVYFILALISSTGQQAGRYAAWFGGLILLATGLGEAASLAKLLDLGGIGGTPPSGGGGGGGILPTPTGTQPTPIGEIG